MTVTFLEVVEAAMATFPSDDWIKLTPAQQNAAVYREMRRLDAEEARLAERELKRRSA
jgi:hypothetical protein